MKDEVALLTATGANVRLLDSGCCGMAGPFGFEKDKFSVSQALAERVLLPAIRSASAETILVSDGFSCREQIKQNTPRQAVHLAEVLAGKISHSENAMTVPPRNLLWKIPPREQGLCGRCTNLIGAMGAPAYAGDSTLLSLRPAATFPEPQVC